MFYQVKHLTKEEYSNNIIWNQCFTKKKFLYSLKLWLSNCDNTDPNILTDIEGLSKQGCLFKKHINDS